MSKMIKCHRCELRIGGLEEKYISSVKKIVENDPASTARSINTFHQINVPCPQCLAYNLVSVNFSFTNTSLTRIPIKHKKEDF
jgi:hypothetical protein